MKKSFILTVILCLFASKITFSQSILLTPNQMNSRQSNLIDNIILQGTNPPNIVGIRHGGTLAAPTATISGSWLISMEGKGHTGTGISNTRSAIRFETTQAWTSTANGTKTDFYTTPNGSNILTHRMVINEDGKVGIGTGTSLTPTAKLQITHDGADLDPHLRIHTTGTYSRINWSTNTNSNFWTAQSDLESATAANNYWRLEYNTSPLFFVKGNGNIGIGTLNPDTKLHISGSDNDGTTATLKITSGAQNMLFDGNEIDAVGNDLNLNYNSTYDIILANGGGNVGIGTTSPNNKLDVLGIIRANEVIVETGWADYVFNEDYQLKPLEDVEAFIKENKHLPAVPSAANIQDKGAHVAELMTKMMEKIEELTLYSIQQKKEIDALKKRLDEKK